MYDTSRINFAISFTVCLMLVLGVGACGDDGGDSQAQPVSKDDMPDRLAGLYCEKVFSCCSATEREGILGNTQEFSSEQNCMDTLSSEFRGRLPALRDAEEAGRASYDGEKVGECLAEAESKSCSDFDKAAFLADCFPATTAKVSPGGSCEESFECKDGTCSENSTCVALATGGDDCSEAMCEDGFYCDSSSVCRPKKSNGESCSSFAECESAICENSVCSPKKTAGETCVADIDCVSGVCNRNDQGDDTCLAAPVCDGE